MKQFLLKIELFYCANGLQAQREINFLNVPVRKQLRTCRTVGAKYTKEYQRNGTGSQFKKIGSYKSQDSLKPLKLTKQMIFILKEAETRYVNICNLLTGRVKIIVPISCYDGLGEHIYITNDKWRRYFCILITAFCNHPNLYIPTSQNLSHRSYTIFLKSNYKPSTKKCLFRTIKQLK